MVKSAFLMFSAVVFLCFGYQACEATEADGDAGFKKLISRVDGYVLFFGWEEGHDINYDITKLTEKQKEEHMNNGLKVIAKKFEDADSHDLAGEFSEILARYYALKKDTKKSLYWSFKAAEHGSSFCMHLLAISYRTGDGVVQDLEEGIKWVYLAAAAGSEVCRQWVNQHSSDLLHEGIAPILKEAQKRAKNWMESHQELFFSPN